MIVRYLKSTPLLAAVVVLQRGHDDQREVAAQLQVGRVQPGVACPTRRLEVRQRTGHDQVDVEAEPQQHDHVLSHALPALDQRRGKG